MARITSINLGERLDDFVTAQIQSGRYASATDVIRAGLQLLEDHNRTVELRDALADGEESGIAGPLDMTRIKRQARLEFGAR